MNRALLHRFLTILVVWLLLCTCLLSKAQVFARNQNKDNGSVRISILATNESVNDILKKIKSATGFSIFMSGQTVQELNGKTSINVKNARLDNILQDILSPRGFIYQFNDKVIIIRKKELDASLLENKGDSSIRTISVNGRIIDPEGNPLIGATVIVKGTADGGVTDADGKFSLPKVSRNAKLLIRSVGFETREVPISGNNILIRLNLLANNLDETVVIAYGTTTKRFNTGNIGTVKAKDIEKQPVSNPLLALQGRIPGITIEQSTGLPGSGVAVRIQGANSLRKNNDPLYVIDGVPYSSRMLYTLSNIQGSSGGNAPEVASVPGGAGSPLSFINPQDIESIDVLKDADATSIYGSRAANGAILITTKKGRSGKTQVDVNLQQGWGVVSRRVKLLNTPEYLALRKEAYENDGSAVPTASTPPDQSNLDLTHYSQSKYTDWQDVLIGNTSQQTRMNASVSGGNANTQFLMGAGYSRETTVFPGDLSDVKGSLHFNINNTSSNQRFKITLSGNYMRDDNHLIGEDLTSTAMNLAPNAPDLYLPDGSLNWDLLPNGDAGWMNPLSYLKQKYRNKTQNVILNNTVSYEVLPGLDIRNSFGYTNLRSDEVLIKPSSMYVPQDRIYYPNESNFSTGEIATWILEPQLTYKEALRNAALDFLLGVTFQENTSSRSSIKGTGYSSELLLENAGAAPNREVSNGLAVYKYNAIFGRVNYILKNRYIFNFSGRRDGSSRFGVSNLFHNFGSVAGSWIFSEESFLKHQTLLSFGKIRASYGTTGNDGIGDYQFLSLYDNVFSVLPYQGVVGLTPVGLSNPYLQWEETKKLSVGLELSFLKDRISFSTNYYRNRSSNQLLSYSLPIMAGFESISQNLNAKIQNIGWEFNLNTENLKGPVFKWTSNLNLTVARNKLLSYPGFEESPYLYDFAIGQPTDVKRAYKFLGVDPQTGLYQIADKSGKPLPEGSFGTADDLAVNMNMTPKFYGGLQNSFTFKGIELDVLFQFVKQDGLYNYIGTKPGLFYGAGNMGNQPADVLNRWKKPGDVAPVQRASNTTPLNELVGYYNALSSNALFSDASFIRLKNLSISWTLPGAWQQKLRMSNTRVFLQGQNLLTITSYKGLDPENRSSYAIPPLRVITLGARASF